MPTTGPEEAHQTVETSLENLFDDDDDEDTEMMLIDAPDVSVPQDIAPSYAFLSFTLTRKC